MLGIENETKQNDATCVIGETGRLNIDAGHYKEHAITPDGKFRFHEYVGLK